MDVANLELRFKPVGNTEAVRAMQSVESQAKKTEVAANKMSGSFNEADKSSKKAAQGVGAFDRVTASATSSLRAYGTAFIAAFGAQQLIRTIDQYTKFTAQLKLATDTQEQYNQALSDSQRIAKITQSDISSISTLYARLNTSLKDVGVTQTEVARITENVGLALKISGATAQESSSAILQLSQAFASGVLRGEEFNAVSESAPALMRALAESIGVPIGALREMASNGEITGQVLNKAFGDEKLLDKFRQQAKEVNTINGAWTVFANQLTITIGRINELTGASKILITILEKAATLLSVFEGGEKGSILRNFLDTGDKARQDRFSAMSTGQLRNEAKFYGDARKALDARLKQQQSMTLGGMNPAGNIAPNFNATIETQDIDKIHEKQEQALKKQQDLNKKYAEQRQIARDAETKRRLGALELEYTTEALNYEKLLDKSKATYDAKEKQRKEFAKMDEKFNDVIQKSLDKRYNEELSRVKRAEEEKRREFEKTVDGNNDTFREGFASLINGGKGSWKAFTQSLVTTFKTTVANKIYKMFAEPFVIKLIASVLGIGASASAAASGAINSITGGSSGIGGLLGSVKSFFDGGNSSIIGAIEGFGSTLANGLGGIRDTIGGFVGANAGVIANLSAFSGAALSLLQGDFKGAAFQGAGAGIGLALGGPIGGAIGSFIGGSIGKLFGGSKLPPRTFSSQTASLDNGVFTSNSVASRYKNAGANDGLNGLNEKFLKSLSAIFDSFGTNGKLVSSGTITQKKRVESGFSAYLDDVLLYSFYSGKVKTNISNAFSSLVETVLGTGLAQAIQSSTLSAGVKKFFDGLTKKEEVNEAINALITLNSALKDLPPIFNAVRNAIDTTAYTTTIEALKAQFQAIGVFTDLFYSDSEKFVIATEQITSQFKNLGLILPSSRKAYRDLVESINVVDEATRDQFNGLIALAPAMDAYFKQLEQEKLIKQEIAGIDINRFRTFLDFNVAKSYVNTGMNIPVANMPSYEVGTSYVPNDGVAMLHQGEAVLTRSDNQSMTSNTSAMVSLLNRVVSELSDMKQDIKRGADGSMRTARELEDITGGDIVLLTRAA